MATHSSILAWIIPWTEKPLGYNTQGHKESDTTATEFACRVLCGHVILTHYPSKYLVHTVERFSIVLKKGNLSIYALQSHNKTLKQEVPVHCSMSGSNYCFLTYIQISQEEGKWSRIPIS